MPVPAQSNSGRNRLHGRLKTAAQSAFCDIHLRDSTGYSAIFFPLSKPVARRYTYIIPPSYNFADNFSQRGKGRAAPCRRRCRGLAVFGKFFTARCDEMRYDSSSFGNGNRSAESSHRICWLLPFINRNYRYLLAHCQCVYSKY